jgi:hypothetical protein
MAAKLISEPAGPVRAPAQPQPLATAEAPGGQSASDLVLLLQDLVGNRAAGALLDSIDQAKARLEAQQRREDLDAMAAAALPATSPAPAHDAPSFGPINEVDTVLGVFDGPEPAGEVQTVTDPMALIRSPPPALASMGTVIPAGSRVVVRAVGRGTNGNAALVEEVLDEGVSGAPRAWGWTLTSNLSGGELAGDEPEVQPQEHDDGGGAEPLDNVEDIEVEVELDLDVGSGPGPDPVPARVRTDEERLADLQASRETATVETVQQRELYFINPTVLGAFKLEMEGGVRRTLFKAGTNRDPSLESLLRKQLTLPKKQAAALARAKAARDRARVNHDRAKAGSATRAKREAKLAEFEATLEAMPALHKQQREDLDAAILAKAETLRPKIVAALARVSEGRRGSALRALDQEGAVVRIRQSNLKVTFGRDPDSIALDAAGPRFVTDRPHHGVYEGGSKRVDADLVTARIERALDDVSDAAERTRRLALMRGVLNALLVAEGRPDSLNTYDSARITMGSGIAAAGRLQDVFWQFKASDPEGFYQQFGRFGIDIFRERRNSNPVFTVVVPPEASRTDWARETPSGTVLRDDAAEEFIINDPVLMAALRRAGGHAGLQGALIDGALVSIERGRTFSFVAGEHGPRVNWADVVGSLGDDYLVATQAVAANWAHGTGGTGGLAALVGTKYLEIITSEGIADPRNHASLSREARMDLVKFVAARLKTKRHKAFRSQFAVGPELWP